MSKDATATIDDSTATLPVETDTTGSGTGTNTRGAAAGQDDASHAGDKTQATTTGQAEDVFIDPKDLPEELQPHFKKMQAAFTKKMQGISRDRDKITAYESFERDPIGSMQAMALRMGYQLTPAQAAAAVASATGNEEPQEFKSWGEVREWVKKDIMAELKQSLAPVFEGVQKVTASNIEKQLNDIDANWRMYEDDMKDTLRTHPTLVNDVSKLYRLSVPEEVLSSRAVQSALKKVEEKGKSASMHGSTTVPKTQPAMKKATSFDEAVSIARDTGKKEGWYK